MRSPAVRSRWASSNTGVASVTTSGVVTGAKVGTATITATSEGKSASATIHVNAGSVSHIAVSPGSIGLVAGGTQQLSVSLTDAAGNALAAQTVAWSSSSTGTATVSSSGVVTGVHTGSATISATLNGATGSASVAVSAGAVHAVSVTPSTATLSTGGTKQFTAVLTDAAGNVLSGAVAWSSSNTSVATINSAGLLTAVHSGSTTVTAAAGGASDNSAVTVSAGAVNAVAVTPGSVSLVAGGTQQLTAAVTDAGGVRNHRPDDHLVELQHVGRALSMRAGWQRPRTPAPRRSPPQRAASRARHCSRSP